MSSPSSSMDIYMGAFQRSLVENERQTHIWSDYLKELKEVDFSFFKDKLKVPALIPIGNWLSLRGELVHTNEITVALGANYFVKCTVKQAEIIMQHRIKVAEENLKLLEKEKEYLENHLLFTEQNILKESGKEIIEDYKEDEEELWRKKHKENIRKQKMDEKITRDTCDISDNDLMERLEELELREELEQELEIIERNSKRREKISTDNNELEKGDNPCLKQHNENQDTDTDNLTSNENTNPVNKDKNTVFDEESTKESINTKEKIRNLKNRLTEIKSIDKAPCISEEEVFRRLEQLEEQEMLEDELDRLEDEAEETSDEDFSSAEEIEVVSSKKSISFAGDSESNCIEINFKHSDTVPDSKIYNKEDGICKPSDIYSAFPENFKNTTRTSILKKSKYADEYSENKNEELTKKDFEIDVKKNERVNVVIGDIHENVNENKIVSSERPVSKFKAMRMQKRSDQS